MKEYEYKLPANPAWLMLPALAGGAAGFLLVTWGTEETVVDRKFAELPEIHLWRLLIAAQFAYFAGVLPAIVTRLRHVLADGYARTEIVVVSVSMIGALLAFFAPVIMAPTLGWGITVLDQRMPWVPVSAAVVVLATYFGLMLLYFSYRRLLRSGDRGILTVRDYLDKKQHARWFLSTLGVMIALGTLATGALRQALEAIASSGMYFSPPPLSAGMVLAYGAYFTMLLAIVYAPVHIAEQAAGKRIYVATIENKLSGDSTFGDFVKLRKEANEILELGSSMRENMQSSLVILSPILAALVSTLLESG